MKIRHALLGSIVVAALAPRLLWAAPGTSSVDNGLQRALGPGASEQDRSNAALGHKADAPSQAGQGAAFGPSHNSSSANRGAAAAPAGGTQLSALAAKKSKPQSLIAPVRSPQAKNGSPVSKVPGAAALAGPSKARAAGPAVAPQRNAIGAVSPAQNGVPMPTHPGAGAVAAREPLALAAPRPGSFALGGGAPSAPANAVARRSPVSAAVGGAPASYEPPRNAKLALIGGTMMKRNKF